MRKINEIIVHCSANEPWSGATFDSIKDYHINERRYKDIGYHYVIDEKGTIHVGRPLRDVGAHCKGHNSRSIGICYIGGIVNGMPTDTRTYPQCVALAGLIHTLCNDFSINSIVGHNVYNPRKSCPCFDANYEFNHLIKKLL